MPPAAEFKNFASHTVPKLLRYTIFTAAALAVAAASYHVGSPKLVLVNLSDSPFKELVLTLPSSRVSVGPVAPRSSSTIYFSRQARSGAATYALRSRDAITIGSGTIQYAESGQFFREITVTIQADGTVSANIGD